MRGEADVVGGCVAALSVLIIVVVLAIFLSGCNFTVPTKPPSRWCYPAKSWMCHPNAEWSLM